MSKGRSKIDKKKTGEDKKPARPLSSSPDEPQRRIDKPDDMMSRVLNGLVRYERRKRRRRIARRVGYLVFVLLFIAAIGVGTARLLAEKSLQEYVRQIHWIRIEPQSSDKELPAEEQIETIERSDQLAEQRDRPA